MITDYILAVCNCTRVYILLQCSCVRDMDTDTYYLLLLLPIKGNYECYLVLYYNHSHIKKKKVRTHTHTHAHAHTHTKKESYYFGSCSPSANKLICDAGNGTRLRGILLQILTAQRSELDSDHIGSPRYAGRWLCWRDGISIIAVEVIYVSVCTCGEQRVV